MKLANFCLTLFLIIVCGCVYDPPRGFITIINNSDSTIYVRYSDTDYIRKEYEMKPYVINNQMFDENGKKMDSIVFPEYRALPHKKAYLHGFGTPQNRQIPNNKGAVYLFFISEDVLTKRSWADICNNQLYNKKIRFSKHKLDSLNWIVSYE